MRHFAWSPAAPGLCTLCSGEPLSRPRPALWKPGEEVAHLSHLSHLQLTGTRCLAWLQSRCGPGPLLCIQLLFIGVTGSGRPGTLEFSKGGACGEAGREWPWAPLLGPGQGWKEAASPGG